MADAYLGFTDDDDEGVTGDPAKDNASFQELRAHARQLEKQVKALSKEAEELRTFRTQAETAEKLSRARSFGLTDTQAEAFLKLSEGDVTPEAVQGFRVKLGLAAPETLVTDQGEVAGQYPATQFSTPTFNPISAGGTVPVRNILTYEQYRELLVKDPQSAIKAVAENRVDGIYKNPE